MKNDMKWIGLVIWWFLLLGIFAPYLISEPDTFAVIIGFVLLCASLIGTLYFVRSAVRKADYDTPKMRSTNAAQWTQLFTVEEVEQALQEKRKVEWTILDYDRIDAPAANLPGSGGWIPWFITDKDIPHHLRFGRFRATFNPITTKE